MSFYQTYFLETIFSFLPEIFIISSLLMVIIVDLFNKNSLWLTKIALIGVLFATIILIVEWIHPLSNNLLSNYEITGFTITFRSLITMSAGLSILISEEYIQRSGMAIAEFLIFLLTATIGGLFLCGANDLVTLFVSLECLSLSSYLLAGYSKKDIRSNEASMKYLLVGGASSAIIAYGFSWLYGLSGGKIQFFELFLSLNHANSLAIWVSLICILVGLGFKLSAVPFHQWTPDVYEGSPTPVVAFFSVVSKTASLGLTIRLLNIIFPTLQTEWEPIISILAILTMIFGNLIAATQTSMKRLLAYSSISQAGYLMIGLLYGQTIGYTPIILYMLTYIFMNLGAFACIILIGLRTGTDQIRDYNGLYFKDPALTISLTICLLSLAGIPPFAGFFGKIYLFWCGWKAGLYAVVYVGLITSVISLYYYLRIIKIMITKEKKEQSVYTRRYSAPNFGILPNSSLEFSIAICVFFSTTLGLIFNPIINITDTTLLVANTILD
jgi:NAD(P)H-quinone oxidoreductase subunit 2